MPSIWSKYRLSLSKWISSVERTLWRHSPFHDQDPAKDGLTLWRERILFSVLAAGNGLAILALIPSVFMAFSEGLWLLAIIDICAVLGSACLLMIGRIDFRMKTAGVLLITFLIGIAVITQAGFLSGGSAWLFCFAVLSGVMLGLRAALVAILLNANRIVHPLVAFFSGDGEQPFGIDRHFACSDRLGQFSFFELGFGRFGRRAGQWLAVSEPEGDCGH